MDKTAAFTLGSGAAYVLSIGMTITGCARGVYDEFTQPKITSQALIRDIETYRNLDSLSNSLNDYEGLPEESRESMSSLRLAIESDEQRLDDSHPEDLASLADTSQRERSKAINSSLASLGLLIGGLSFTATIISLIFPPMYTKNDPRRKSNPYQYEPPKIK